MGNFLVIWTIQKHQEKPRVQNQVIPEEALFSQALKTNTYQDTTAQSELRKKKKKATEIGKKVEKESH